MMPDDVNFKISELYQAGIVVCNIERSVECYEKIFGIGPWQFMEIDSSFVHDMTYHGKPVQHRFKAAFAMVGQLQIELIQPLEGPNIYSDHLEKHGEGLHHLGHMRVKNMQNTIEAFEKMGYACLQSGRIDDGGYAYIDTVKDFGTMIELLEMPDEVSAPGRT